MNPKRAFSVLGVFDSVQTLMDAIPYVKARAKGRLEAYTPYPIHGIDKALGLRKSPIGGMVLIMAVIGAISALAFELWTSGADYPMITAGKPPLSWEAFVPIMFEVTVLFATFTAGLGMLLILNRLPFFGHPMLQSKSMSRITRDAFALAVEEDGGRLDVSAMAAVLLAAGAKNVEIVEDPLFPGPLSTSFFTKAIASIAISCLAAGYLTYWAVKLFPESAPMVHMLNQPRLDAQRQDDFFSTRFGMRLPVEGAVARGHIPYVADSLENPSTLGNPLPRTETVLKQGRQAFVAYCSVCHGILGNGTPTLTAAYGAKPVNLVSIKIKEYSDGAIYNVIRRGRNAMPSYSAELTDDERWDVVHYVRVLQRALDANDEDIPGENSK